MDRLIKYDDLKASFELPEKISVGVNLRFWAGWRQAEDHGDYVVIKRWELINSLGLLTNWKCDYFKDPKASLDDIEDVRVADLVIRIVSDIFQYMLGLRAVEKK